MRIESTNKNNQSKNEQPLVSVVMPVYNVEPYIEQALDSVIRQSYDNIEIIVVDDQSPDNSIALIQQRYRDERIRIIRQKNRGLAGARNTGIRHSNGRYIAFLDSDDFWQVNKLELHIKAMQRNSNYGVSFSSSLFVDDQGQRLNRLQAPKKKCDYSAKDVFCRNPIGNGSAPVIRKGILEQIAFFSEEKTENGAPYAQYFDENLRQSEDVDCWTRIALTTATDFHYIDQPLTNYRLNNEGLSANVEKQFETWMHLLNKLEHYAPNFAQKYGPVAKVYQYRYLARRSIFQGQANNAVKFMWLAFKTNPLALMKEFRRTAETTIVSLVLAFLPSSLQRTMIARLV